MYAKTLKLKWGVGQTDGLKIISPVKDMFYLHSIISDCPKNGKNFFSGLTELYPPIFLIFLFFLKSHYYAC